MRRWCVCVRVRVRGRGCSALLRCAAPSAPCRPRALLRAPAPSLSRCHAGQHVPRCGRHGGDAWVWRHGAAAVGSQQAAVRPCSRSLPGSHGPQLAVPQPKASALRRGAGVTQGPWPLKPAAPGTLRERGGPPAVVCDLVMLPGAPVFWRGDAYHEKHRQTVEQVSRSSLHQMHATSRKQGLAPPNACSAGHIPGQSQPLGQFKEGKTS